MASECMMKIENVIQQSEQLYKEKTKECYLPGNIVFVRFDQLTIKTKAGKKKKVIREIPVHAVAEEFLDLRFGKNFFYNHWVFLVFVLFVLNMYSFLYGLNELLQTCLNISTCLFFL